MELEGGEELTLTCGNLKVTVERVGEHDALLTEEWMDEAGEWSAVKRLLTSHGRRNGPPPSAGDVMDADGMTPAGGSRLWRRQ